MDLQKLKRFFTVVEYMSITRAAEALYLSQPTLSKYISALEEELGTRLFVRENQQLLLTDAGKMLYDRGRVLTAQTDDLIFDLMQLSTERHALTIVLEHIQNENMFFLLKELYESENKLEFNSRTITNSFNEITDYVSSRNVDLGVVCRRSVDELLDTFSAIRLFRDHMVLLVSEQHRLAGQTSIHIRELSGERIVYRECSDNMCELYRQLSIAAGQDSSAMRFMDREDQLSRVKANLAVAFCGKNTATANLPNTFRTIELEGVDSVFQIVLLWRKDNANHHISTFIHLLDRYFPDYEWLGQ